MMSIPSVTRTLIIINVVVRASERMAFLMQPLDLFGNILEKN